MSKQFKCGYNSFLLLFQLELHSLYAELRIKELRECSITGIRTWGSDEDPIVDDIMVYIPPMEIQSYETQFK